MVSATRPWRLAAVAAALLCAASVGAQVGGGGLTGVVTDQSGAAVPGVTVTVVVLTAVPTILLAVSV